jgi:uncharacterized protein YtpQ (UPF0354 family)
MMFRARWLWAGIWLGACSPQPPAAAPPPSASPTDPKTTRAEFTAVVRADSFLGQLSRDERANAIAEPLAAGLVIVYMVDQHGVARFARAEDLKDSGVTRDALRAVAEWNIAAALRDPLRCERDAITTFPTGSFYQSSRLLLTQQWSDLAAKGAQIFVAVPSNDTLLVACDATPVTLAKLATAIQNSYPRAAHPVSPSILRWTAEGWVGLELQR